VVWKQKENGVSDEKQFDAKKFSEGIHDRIHRGIHEGLKMGPGRKQRGGLFWGAVLTLGGFALLLDQMGIISVERLWRFWPMILIFIGLWNLACQSGRVFGAVMVILGVLFQLDTLGIAHFSWGQLWPLAIIAAGVLIMWSSLQARRVSTVVSNVPGGESQTDPRTTLNEMAIFGGIERRITSQDFQGGYVHAVFGGVQLDLREANMQQDEANLEINAVFGGVELRVPEAWQVVSRGQAFFGGFVDETRNYRPENPANPTRKSLILTGAAVFGGVEIKN
jgi:predicted membrane protein